LSTLIFTHSNVSKSQIFSIPGTYALMVRRALNRTDSDVTCTRLCDQGKITKRIERQSGL